MKENNNYFSWTILSETEAVKRCDKSFFHYKETGIPHEIGWFFDAENLMPGDDREITILFGNSEYKAVVSNTSTGRYKINWYSSLGTQFATYNMGEVYPIVAFRKMKRDYYSVSFNDSAEKQNGTLLPMIKRFGSYIVSRDGIINFQDRNTFLGREENYKSRITIKAQDALQYERWTEKWIDNGKIISCSDRAMSCAENLVNKHQQIDFKNKLNNTDQQTQLRLARTIFNIYKSKGEREEASAFADAVAAFGGKYDTIAYLFFIKDSSRFLPISTSHLEKSLESVGFKYKLSGNCSWDNYIGFINILSDIRDLMAQVLPIDEVRLIDAHSFLWVVGEKDRPTDFLNWNPDDKAIREIEEEAENHLEAEGIVQYRRHSSYYYTRNNEVSRITKRRAGGNCELCGKPAPFNDGNGDPYLETHHIIWLSRGGEDSTNNTAALCPNCHKRMHVLDYKSDISFLLDLRK